MRGRCFLQAVSENFLIVVVGERRVDKKAGTLCACFFITYSLIHMMAENWKSR